MTFHFACLEEQKWLVLLILTFEQVGEKKIALVLLDGSV